MRGLARVVDRLVSAAVAVVTFAGGAVIAVIFVLGLVIAAVVVVFTAWTYPRQVLAAVVVLTVMSVWDVGRRRRDRERRELKAG